VMGSQAAVLLLVFFAQRIILTELTAAENGTLFLERRLTEMFVGIVADFGMNGILLRRAAQEPSRSLEIVASAVWLRLILWGAATLAVCGFVIASDGPVLDVLMWSTFLLIASRSTLLRYALEVQHRGSSRFVLPSVVAVVDALLFYGLIWFFRDQCSPSTVITMFLLSSAPGFLIVAMINRGSALRPSSARLAEMRTLFVESLPMLAFIVLWGFQDKIDAAILEMFATRADVGVLGAAYTSLGPIISLLPQTLALVALPEISRLMSTSTSQAIALASCLMRFTVLMSTALTVVSIVLIPAFVQYVSGGRYAGFDHHFELFVWTAPGIGMLVFIQETLVAMGKQRETLWIAITMLICTVGAGFALVPMHQVLGSITAKVIASGLGAIIAVLILQRVTHHTLERGILVRCLAFVLSMVAINEILRTLSMYPAIQILALLCAVVASAVAFKIIHGGEWLLIRQLVTRAQAR